MTALTGSITQPQHLPGQYADPETGLYQNWWRDYDPALCRYMQADPIRLAGGANLYGYAGGNPVSYVDPEGQAACVIAAVPAISKAGSTVVTGTIAAIGAWYTAQQTQQLLDAMGTGTTFQRGDMCPFPNNLMNEGSETGPKQKKGGKKAQDSGRSEPHGDGGRAIKKANRQIADLNKKIEDLKK